MHTITFYSYKGGVGRSLLVANCALHLAQLGLRLVVLDLDLEAPGLHYKFRTSLPPNFMPKRGIIDLIDDYASSNELYTSLAEASFEVRLEEPLREPNEPPPEGRLHVIPAGSAPSLDYWQRVANIDWRQFLYDEDATGVEFFIDLRERIATEFSADILLIDSRTGITEIGNVATSVLADKVVCIVTDSPENLEGARAVLRGLRQHRRLSDNAPIELKLAVSRPHASQAIAERLERIRLFFEEPAELLDATLVVDAPYPLTYAPEVEENEHLVISSVEPGKTSQLALDYIALAEEMVPEHCWKDIRTAWTRRSKSPYIYSVWNYLWFSLQQPGVPIDGLYRQGRRCSIVVPGFDANTPSLDGRPLSAWFEDNRTLGVPIALVAQVPNGAERVPDPSLEDLVSLRDRPHTHRELDAELCLRLPRTFPAFRCAGRDGGEGMVIEVERPLRADDRTVLRREWSSLGYGSTMRLATRVNPLIRMEEPKFRLPNIQGDINLIPSRRLSSVFSAAIRGLLRADEELWMSSRHAIYRGELNEPSDVLPGWRKEDAARLLVGSGGLGMPGISKLLPFCDQLLFELPLGNDVDAMLAASGFTRDDLFTLAKQGRIVVLLPQSLDRYDPALLNELGAQAPEALVLSRTLCAAKMIELRRRLYPWFFPNFDLRERYERLHRAWTRASTASVQSEKSYEKALVHMLSEIWSREEWHTHDKGAMASFYLGGGLGTLLADWVKLALKRDLVLESMPAAASVECAAALGAAVVPLHRPEFSLLGLTFFGAALLSIQSDLNPTMLPPMLFSLPTTGSSAIEMANLDSDEFYKMRRLIASLVNGGADPVTSMLKGIALGASGLTKGEIEKDSLRLIVPTSAYLDGGEKTYGRDATLRAMRNVFAEDTETTDSVLHYNSKNLPSIIVAVLDTFVNAPSRPKRRPSSA